MHITSQKGVRIFREYYLNMQIKNSKTPQVAKIPVEFCTRSVKWLKKNGDFIMKYDVLAILEDQTPIYSPFSGTFTGFIVGPRLGQMPAMQYAVVETKNDETPLSPLWNIAQLPSSYQELAALSKKGAIIDELRRCYLAALFENYKNYKVLLIDAVDDEPYDLSKSAVLLQYTEEVFTGAQLIANALEIPEKQIVLLKNFITKPFFAQKTPGFKKISMRGKYPAFPAVKQYSSKISALRIGPKACRAIYRAAVFGEPQLSHTVTVWGDGVEQPANLEVYNGVPISELLTQCAASGTLERVVAGGVMTGYTASLFYPLFGWDNALSAMLSKKHHPVESCTNCGRCAIVCPIGLAPYYTLRTSSRKGERRAGQLCHEMCVHCGACSYACPARIPLENHITNFAAKQEVSQTNE